MRRRSSPRHETLGYTFDNQPTYVNVGGGTEVRYLRHADQRVVRLVKKNGVWARGVYLGPFEYQQREGTVAYTKVVLQVSGHGRHAQVETILSGSDPNSLPIFYFHTDLLGSGHVLTANDGTLLSQEEYLPYGSASDRRDARNRYRYLGVERDEETGLMMTGPRTYDAGTGRFWQGDPEIKVHESPYLYAAADPVGKSDPSGHDPMVMLEKGTNLARNEGAREGYAMAGRVSWSFIEGAVAGDFVEDPSWAHLVGQTVAGELSPLGDFRDVSASVMGYAEGKESFGSVAAASVVFLPGGNTAKGLVKAAKKLDVVGLGAKHADEVVNSVLEASKAAGKVKYDPNRGWDPDVLADKFRKRKEAGELPDWMEDALDYELESADFFQRGQAGEMHSYQRASGERVYFDESSGWFGVEAPSGEPTTFFMPDDGLSYFLRDKAGHGG
ncbi:MAG: RHS repeat-associated core domain-containing protein [Deltaproteobacteria bacterium]|nr:RHS repeat-associated core domain-containing protein [Deltaproteobacteria bacterium]